MSARRHRLEVGRRAPRVDEGEHEVPDELLGWRRSYADRGAGEVVLNAFPEPYIGPLAGSVMLGLNPGAAALDFRGPDGLFTRDVAATSYREWAACSPYTGAAWEASKGRNRYVHARFEVARRLHRDPLVRPQDMLTMGLYPRHSARVTGSMRPPPAVLQEWVRRPLAEMEVPYMFAFGAPCLTVARRLGFLERPPLDVEWEAPSRRCALFALSSTQDLVVLHHSSWVGPPNARDTERLRQALAL